MSAINSNDVLVTETKLQSDFKKFYEGIYPYLNGAAHAGFTPVGTVISVMGNSAPSNYLICDGSVYNISDYPELADYFEEQFGTKNNFGGNGTTTFGVPDLRGEFLRGTGTNGHTNQGNGETVGTHQDATIHTDVYRIKNTLGISNSGTSFSSNHDYSYGRSSYSATEVQTNSNASTTYGEYTSRPTNTSVLYCIATKNIYIDARYDYSTVEKVVGTWIDGKPLYQKTIDYGTLPNKTYRDVQTGLTNIKVRSIQGYAYSSSAGLTLLLSNVSASNADNQVSLTVRENASIIRLHAGANADMSSYTECYITLQYTKTTD